MTLGERESKSLWEMEMNLCLYIFSSVVQPRPPLQEAPAHGPLGFPCPPHHEDTPRHKGHPVEDGVCRGKGHNIEGVGDEGGLAE